MTPVAFAPPPGGEFAPGGLLGAAGGGGVGGQHGGVGAEGQHGHAGEGVAGAGLEGTLQVFAVALATVE